MRSKRLLAGLLLGVVLCFVPSAGYGEIPQCMHATGVISYLDFSLLKARVDYLMRNPGYLDVDFQYKSELTVGDLPVGSVERGIIVITVRDTRGVFLDKSGVVLLEQFKEVLGVLYSYIENIADNMNTDIGVSFYSKGDILLGYFYQGEYHLWEE